MKNTKKYIILSFVLSVAFNPSLQMFAMEQEPTGEANISSESGIEERDQETLTKRINRLTEINDELNKKLKKESRVLYIEEYNDIKQFQQLIQKIIKTADDMRLGLIPVDIKLINKKTDNIILAAPHYLQSLH